MKEIFDWLREQIDKHTRNIGIRGLGGFYDVVFSLTAKNIINEAEAKWEADCCEWKLILGNTFVAAVSHENEVFAQTDMKFCPYCGKRIKVVE